MLVQSNVISIRHARLFDGTLAILLLKTAAATPILRAFALRSHLDINECNDQNDYLSCMADEDVIVVRLSVWKVGVWKI